MRKPEKDNWEKILGVTQKGYWEASPLWTSFLGSCCPVVSGMCHTQRPAEQPQPWSDPGSYRIPVNSNKVGTVSDLGEKVPVSTPHDEERSGQGMTIATQQINLEVFLKKIEIFHFPEKSWGLLLAKGQKLHGPKLGGNLPWP